MASEIAPSTLPVQGIKNNSLPHASLFAPKPGTPRIQFPDTPLSISPVNQGAATMNSLGDVKHPHLKAVGSSAHADVISEQCTKVKLLVKTNDLGYAPVHVDFGHDITPAHIVAVSKHGVRAGVQNVPAALKRLSKSVDVLHDHLGGGHSLYGVTTGFGGSAMTRTQHTYDLQRALLQMQQSGILPVVKEPSSIYGKLKSSPSVTFMPEEWVRGAILVRCKSLLNGHSAIRWQLVVTLITLLNENLIPLVPLRGSISASGDLSPLSYIAGAMEGNPGIWVWSDGKDGERVPIPSHVALARVKLQPQRFGPKEGLAVLNGTAFSTSVAALALHEANQLALLSQVLTAMGVEALSGAVGSFDPFFAKVRPHKGQAEAARNILGFLKGSSLAHTAEQAGNDDTQLKQDRYTLRTASQWIGPQLEDLALAHEQISVECNSTTDNPLLDLDDETIHHGGNFQAASVSSAMEKTRLCLQMFGRMLFSQCTELINPATNNGLPPNLAADEPSTSYTFKGIDINVAAYMSELAFLANPVSSHVQTAEMGNQAINSLALISARYTHQAIETLSMMCAAYLYALCQALDLRVMNRIFTAAAIGEIRQLTAEAFESLIKDDDINNSKKLQDLVIRHILKQLPETTHMDSVDRFQQIAHTAQAPITAFFCQLQEDSSSSIPNYLPTINEFTTRCSSRLLHIYTSTRQHYLSEAPKNPRTVSYLGTASRKMYSFVREELGVPFHHGLVDHPTAGAGGRGTTTVGGNASVIYEALREGKMYEVVMGLVGHEGREEGEGVDSVDGGMEKGDVDVVNGGV